MPLSDILSCPINQLEALVTQEDPYSQGEWFQAKNIGMIELSQLGEMLGVGSYDSLSSGFNLAGEPLPEGPWPQTIPESLTTRLCSLSDAEIENICPEWSTIEEFGGHSPVDGLALYLRDLRGFLQSHAGPYFLINAL